MRQLVGALFIAGAVVSVPVAATVTANTNSVCASQEYSWSGNTLLVPWNPLLPTGVVVPAAASGETISILNARAVTYDRYADGQTPTRADVDQQNESLGLTVGGVAVGGLTPDVPDTVAEGAPNDNFSGFVTSSFGGAGTVIPGGELIVRHASLYGFTESPNSVYISSLTVTVQRCTTPATTTPPTTAPPTTAPPTTAPATTTPVATSPATTTPAGPTTTAVSSGGPTTTAAPTTTAGPTTTAVSSGGPTTTATPTPGAPTTTVVSAAGPTTPLAPAAPTPGGSLPATGGDMTLPLLLASLAAGTGTALLLVRRKAGSH